jgi:hypothetical protein
MLFLKYLTVVSLSSYVVRVQLPFVFVTDRSVDMWFCRARMFFVITGL